jgi:hypothetical protein
MLRECPECKGTVSDQANACPRCGYPLVQQGQQSQFETKSPPSAHSPVFMVLGLVGLFVSLFTPRLIVTLPVLGTLCCATISLIRREQARVVSVLVLLAAGGLLLFSGFDTSVGLDANKAAAALKSVEVVNWTWKKDPSFGTKGTIRWQAQLRNISRQYIASARVELTTYDAAGKLVATAFSYVSAIPPGETRSEESFAAYYRTEESAKLQVTDVRFSTP